VLKQEIDRQAVNCVWQSKDSNSFLSTKVLIKILEESPQWGAKRQLGRWNLQ